MEKIIGKALELGAETAKIIDTADIVFDEKFRKYCEDNVCGFYGKNYMCPPDIGTFEEVKEKVLAYKRGVFFQRTTPIKSFDDRETMERASLQQNEIARNLKKYLLENGCEAALCIATKCRYCEKCAKQEDKPCCHRDLAMGCLSAYCIDVAKTAEKLDIPFAFSQEKVTYYALVLFK